MTAGRMAVANGHLRIRVDKEKACAGVTSFSWKRRATAYPGLEFIFLKENLNLKGQDNNFYILN